MCKRLFISIIINIITRISCKIRFHKVHKSAHHQDKTQIQLDNMPLIQALILIIMTITLLLQIIIRVSLAFQTFRFQVANLTPQKIALVKDQQTKSRMQSNTTQLLHKKSQMSCKSKVLKLKTLGKQILKIIRMNLNRQLKSQ